MVRLTLSRVQNRNVPTKPGAVQALQSFFRISSSNRICSPYSLTMAFFETIQPRRIDHALVA
jgi:hypothetical protein